MHILSTWLRHTTVVGLMMLGLVALAPASQAQTADGMTPAEETVCDELSGVLWGLCDAYCEAMDCDYTYPHAADTACNRVLANYMKHSDESVPPCIAGWDEGGDECSSEECVEDCPEDDCGSEDGGGSDGGGSSEPPPA